MTAEPILRARGGVHSPVAHDSALKHVTGEARYVDDLPEPRGCLHVALVTSRWAHARLTGIDAAAALALPGVRAVVTAADIPGPNDIGPIVPGEPLLADGLVEYVGHPVAAVVARDYDTARRAAALVTMEAEALSPVLDLREAAARAHYVLPPTVFQRGEPGPAIEAAPHRLRGEVMVGGQDHFYLETQAALAVPQEDRDMLVHSGTQHPTEVQHMVARLLGLDMNAVTVEVRRMGGGFGGKESQATIIAGIAAVCARVTGRPCKLRLDRDTDMEVTGKRHDFLLSWDVGVDAEGRVLAVDMTLAARCGWSVDLSPGVVSRALSHADNAYYYPHARLTGLFCKTNTQSNTAFRGFGGPQGMMAAEAMMDHIARALKLDPLEVRRRNFYAPGRDVTPYHQTVEHFRLPAMLDALLASSDYDRRRAEIAAFNAGSPVVKKGLAVSPVKFGVSFNKPEMNQAGALVHVYTDGSISLNHGGTEMGQGLFVKVAQVVAEVFGVDLDRIKPTATTTAKVPNTSPTAASSGTDLNGMAAKVAAETIRGRMAAHAAELFGVAAGEVRFAAGRVMAGNKVLDFAELAELCHVGRVALSSTGFYRTPKIHFDRTTNTGRPFFYFAHGLSVSEVAIDTLTGEWLPLRTDILHDVGTSLNPAIDKGQIEGGFVQGLGWLTMEELVWDAEGRLKTHAPSTYKIPTARDVPRDFRVDLLADAPNEEATIFRSKAVGEPPFMLAMSVWLALRDAVASLAPAGWVPPLDAPATPEKILLAVEAAKRS
ncbi:xanthine dehydrogenase molybdopterin binding subunit [Caenispirillum bisanense]|uniref:Xanthine dehydrogenase, molybdenum binding subunit apoprotein n=1 Tax=Caenispirillum bisanense TaxID=414052 RepID=A0A286GAM6_9PROT|nr:xanthine dehydrogenase molybdopterin binding subunit [Caenispirillum bisanense]SOD92577.1 xanthine dehydrogenase, molybdenum binding subunit apoprotein [Caenispirillum bisanense]